ncbi:MAG: asparagine synthase (glutamine-hydrolyzing), partial [Candidatus Aenigmarchaeota archaeon]|nr:asparagine synthase (glutamine-hydrolyzing) [Candidatus Aenigmarchaeota archaeon]
EGIKREINHKSMDNYFTFRYVPGSETIFKGIKKLLPGHFLKFFNNDTLIRKYWDIELSERKKSEQYYSDLILKFLEDSVKMRLISDVPLGAYLSGGLDSSAIVGIMSKFSEKPVKTFSVKFEDETIDESQYAKMVAEHFKTEHHELMVKCSAMETLPKITWHLDEPLADPACIPTLLMSELTKKHVTVVLTGEGSDELFAGYDQYKFINMANRYGFAFRISSILPHKSLKFRRFKNYVKTKNYLSLLSVFDENEKESLYTETVSGKIDNTNIRIDGNSLNNILLFDTKTWLPDDLLVKNDRMTMAHAIEARVPFLDHRFVELSSSIPLKMKLKGKNDKYIYRKAISNLIPKQILKRKKHGFTVPINSWLDGELGEIVSQMFSEINVSKRGYFNHRTVQKILRNHNESQPYYKRQAWSLFTFELWNRMFMDSENINKPNLNILR